MSKLIFEILIINSQFNLGNLKLTSNFNEKMEPKSIFVRLNSGGVFELIQLALTHPFFLQTKSSAKYVNIRHSLIVSQIKKIMIPRYANDLTLS